MVKTYKDMIELKKEYFPETLKKEILRECTKEELIAELVRRSFKAVENG